MLQAKLTGLRATRSSVNAPRQPAAKPVAQGAAKCLRHAQRLGVRLSASSAGAAGDAESLGRGIDSLASHATTQSYVICKDTKSVSVPLGAVQQLPVALQGIIFISIFAALAVCTYLNVTVVGPALAAAAPAVHAALLAARVPLCCALFFVVGVAHFTAHEAIASMYPKPGTWGLWYLPGSASFHTNWTGVAEVAGAVGLALGAAGLPAALLSAYPQLLATSSAALFLLTIAVSPANVYMFTHNAPGPVGAVVPWPLHLLRFFMQVALLTAFWDLGRGVLLGHVPLLP